MEGPHDLKMGWDAARYGILVNSYAARQRNKYSKSSGY